jgi:hypothetical protein
MAADLGYIAFLAFIWLFLKFGPTQLINRLIMAVLGKKGLENVGATALAAQPDRITLMRGPSPHKPEAATSVTSLERRGFERAGSFEVPEMKGLHLHLLVNTQESMIGVVYEHPKAGVWSDVASRYEDGTSFTVTSTQLGGGLEERPGHATMRAVGQPPAALAMWCLKQRPAGQLKRVTTADVVQVFEQAYAESMTWRKGKGLSAAEVKRAGLEKISA